MFARSTHTVVRTTQLTVASSLTALLVYASTCSNPPEAKPGLLSRGSSSSQHINVVSYNLLSSTLAEPDHFPKCDPSNLDAKNRLPRIMDKISEPMKQKSILGLQEVGHDWANGLSPHLIEGGYAFVTGLYGKPFNNYMGVALAYPTDTYTTLEVKIERLSDVTEWPKEEKKTQGKLSWADWFMSPVRYVRGESKESKEAARPPFDPLVVAKSRHNKIVMARLQHKETNKTFWIGTYHMPCLFGTAQKRQVMVIHASLAAQYIQREAARTNDDYILMGDFNFKPEDSSYELLTQGKLDYTHEDCPPKFGTWNPNDITPMRSAYKSFLGEEPPYTNNAVVAWGGNVNPPFVETLDYIFCSEGWKVQKVMDTPPKMEAEAGPYPSASEPSDHIMIGAQLGF